MKFSILCLIVMLGICTSAKSQDEIYETVPKYNPRTNKHIILSAGTYVNKAGNSIICGWISATAGAILLDNWSKNYQKVRYPEKLVKGLSIAC